MVMVMVGCKIPQVSQPAETNQLPASFNENSDSSHTDIVQWRNFFTDKDLQSLVDSALANNQELRITLQEIEIARNEILSRKAALIPTVGLNAGLGVEKVGRYTSQGAGDATTEIKPGKEMPDPLPNFGVAAVANWEVDIWKKLHNAKQAAVTRYLATVEGRNFVLTNLISEVANSYYELLALDNKLAIVEQNIALQKNALEIVKVQKEAARATELAVQKFQAEVLSSQSLEYEIRQNIKETENRINFLLGRYPQEIRRSTANFLTMVPPSINAGIPSQLLINRPDIHQAELELEAAKLDVKVARAEFYPSIEISAALGLNSFSPSYLVKLPESLLYSLAGDLVAPLINRNRIKAEYLSMNARQTQALYSYQRTTLNAFLEVSTQMSNVSNLQKNYELKAQQVDALTKSIEVSNDLLIDHLI